MAPEDVRRGAEQIARSLTCAELPLPQAPGTRALTQVQMGQELQGGVRPIIKRGGRHS